LSATSTPTRGSIWSNMMPQYPIYRGNCPRNVSKDAKYAVRSGKNGPVVALTFCREDDERWYMSTEAHSELVAMVNSVKTAHGNPPNGAFYINEYRHVVVPLVGSEEYFLAGKYDAALRFEFEGKTLSGEPVDLDSNPLSPGDEWVGPHPGIPYVLCAGGSDIRYTMRPRPNVEKNVKLSKTLDPEKARAVAAKVCAVKGHAGGRFYINEFRAVFAPVQEGMNTTYLYVCTVELDEWFPEPNAD